MTSNQAAWLDGKGQKLRVASAETPKPAADHIVVKNTAIAINPVDWKIQDYGLFIKNWPAILGEDVAGAVYEVGSDVKHFKKGDRVIGHSLFLQDADNQSGGFQLYSNINTLVATKLPDNVSSKDGSVLPLAIDTAAIGLYGDEFLGLPLPQLDGLAKSDKVIVVWGGSSSVGATAIQLAKASGVTVISTAAAHNHEFVKYHLKADKVYDYKSASVVDDVIDAIKSSGKEFAGIYDAISVPASFKLVAPILTRSGSANKKLAVTLPASDLPEGIQVGNVLATLITTKYKAIAEHVWGKFLYEALEKGVLKPLPPPEVVGKGLDHVQAGLDRNKAGVSAKKVIVEL